MEARCSRRGRGDLGDHPGGLLRVLEEREVRRIGSRTAPGGPTGVAAPTGIRGGVRAVPSDGTSLSPAGFPGRSTTPGTHQGDRGLALAFIERTSGRERSGAAVLSPEALAALRQYSWPGNVRELGNAIESRPLSPTGSLSRAPTGREAASQGPAAGPGGPQRRC